VVSDWWTPLEDVVARRSPLAVLPRPTRILGALLLPTIAVIAMYAIMSLGAGVYRATHPSLRDGGTFLVQGVLYSVLAVLLGIAAGGILRARAWGMELSLVASFATVALEAFRLSVAPPYGPSASSSGWLAAFNWLLAVLGGVVFVSTLVAIRVLRRPDVNRQIGR